MQNRILNGQLKIIRRWSIAIGICSIALGGCGIAVDSSDSELPQVVSTSTIIADLTEKVGGDEIEHTGILQPGADPHVYEPTPKDSVALEKADFRISEELSTDCTDVYVYTPSGEKFTAVNFGPSEIDRGNTV